jgi:hypothetical protein
MEMHEEITKNQVEVEVLEVLDEAEWLVFEMFSKGNRGYWRRWCTVNSPLTHTPWWTHFAMGYRGVWVNKCSFPAFWQFWWTQIPMGYKGLWVSREFTVVDG